MSVSEPGKIITPWAESGLKNTIPPAANPATGRAGFDQGFSAINMTAKEAGGIPPFGQDFNGIFYEVTNILRYMQAGGQPTFDAALATAIGGYPKGAMVLGSDGLTLWQSKVDSNSTDPNVDPANWGTFDIGLKADLAAPNGSSIVGFQQAGAGSTPRTSQDKMREVVSVGDFGASPTSADNTAEFNAAKAAAPDGNAYIAEGVHELGATDPDYNLHGPGAIRANGVTSKITNIVRKVARESVFFTPDSYQRERYGINFPPPRDPLYNSSSYNFVFSQGSKMNDVTKNLRYNVVFGNMNGCAPGEWGYNDIFGNDAAIYAYNIQRNTAVGSETIPWFGAPNQEWLRTYKHDWWRKPADNPYEPGEPGWDAGGLETLFPGIGARIAAFNSYALTSDEAARCVAFGRDALGHIVKGNANSMGGYQTAGNLFSGTYNTAWGAQALANVVFCDYITAIGALAGRDCLDSTNTLFAGYAAGRTLQNASFSVIIGDRAADTHTSAVNSVLIGKQVLVNETGSLDDKLAISNDAGNPLISGDFVGDNVGINISPNALRAKLHIRNADSGASHTADAGLLIEAGTAPAVTLESSSAGVGRYNWSNTTTKNIAFIEYSHATNAMQFGVNSANKLRLDPGGTLRPTTDNTNSLGLAAQRWSVVYAGTGTINTSDGREKTAPLSIDDAVLDAWGDVQLITFQWLESIRQNGDEARWHFGVIAQQVRDAFAARGLDGTRYGLLCYDEWDDEFEPVFADREVVTLEQRNDPETGEAEEVYVTCIESYDTGEKRLVQAAGNRWGIRPDQCLFLEAAYQRRRCDRIEARLAEIGA